jgi:hypothetical protein
MPGKHARTYPTPSLTSLLLTATKVGGGHTEDDRIRLILNFTENDGRGPVKRVVLEQLLEPALARIILEDIRQQADLELTKLFGRETEPGKREAHV